MVYNDNPKVTLDADDTIIKCNAEALDRLSKETGQIYDINDIDGWGFLNKPVDERLKFFNDEDFFLSQEPYEGAVEFLDELMMKADVTIMTAVNQKFVSQRIQRLSEIFPNFPLNHVIIGERKDMIKADIILDDRIHNIMNTQCRLPVLFRQPWNRKVSGVCTVSNYRDFLAIVDFMSGKNAIKEKYPKIICLVGPGGSNKHEMADILCETKRCNCERVFPISTEILKSNYGTTVSNEEFENLVKANAFLETTYYDGKRYGTKKQDVEKILGSGKNAVAILDISGCMSIYNEYPGQCVIIYLEKNKRDCILSILDKEELRKNQIADRIAAIDYEQKNSILAHYIVKMDEHAVSNITDIVSNL